MQKITNIPEVTTCGGLWNKAQGVPTPGEDAGGGRSGMGDFFRVPCSVFFKKADWKSAYNLLLLHTRMSIFNNKEGKNKSKSTKNIIYGWGAEKEVIFIIL